MINKNEYYVFISYSSQDNEWAIWLRHELEHYHLPASFNGRTDVRDNLRKVFRDRDELSAGPEWDEQVSRALAATNNLIVICSPNAAKSEAVNKEVEAFIALGKEDHIFPFIVEGDKPKDCFPSALKHSKLGGDVNKDGGRDSAFVKVVAGMLKVGFPSLWDRYEKEKAEEERKIREQRDKLLIMQSRFLAEKANDLVDKGDSYTARLLALEALPKDLDNPDRPYVPEAENALRKAFSIDSAIISLGNDIEEQDNLIYNAETKMLISSSRYDNHINFWNLKAGCIAYQIEGSAPIYSLEISSDGKLFATTDDVESFSDYPNSLTDDDTAILIWNIDNHEVIKKIKGPKELVTSVNFDSNNKFLVSVEAHDDSFKIWSLEDGCCLYTVRNTMQNCISALFCPNKMLIVSLWHETDKGTYSIALWDMEKACFINKLTYNYPPTKMAMSPDGNLFAVSFDEQGEFPIYVYDTHLFQEIHKLEGHLEYVNNISFNEEGRLLVSCSKDSSIKVWDLALELCSHTFDMPTIKIGVLSALFISCDLIVSSNEDKTIRIWNRYPLSLLTGPVFMLNGHTSWIGYLSYNQDGSKLISASGDCTIKMWNPETGTLVRSLYGHSGIINSVSFNHKGNLIVSASRDKSIIIWGLSGEKLNIVYNAHEGDILSVSFSKDDKYLVSASDDNTVKVWSVQPWSLMCSYKCVGLTSAQCSSEDDYILVSHGKDISLLDMKCNLIRSYSGHNEIVNGAVFNTKGNMFASFSEDCTIRIWELNSVKPIVILKDDNYVCSANFSPDDMYLVSTSGYEWNNNGEYLRIWSLKTGELIETLTGGIHNTKQMFAVFSPDGHAIASASYDGTIEIWDRTNLSNLIDKTRERFKNRQLTTEERKKYYLD